MSLNRYYPSLTRTASTLPTILELEEKNLVPIVKEYHHKSQG